LDSVQKEVAQIERTIVKLFNAGDVRGILHYFSKNFVGFSSTQHERLTSLSQLKKTFLHYLEEGEEVTYAIKNLKIIIYGEGALSSFYWTVDIRKKKKSKSIHGRGSHVFLMTDQGWRIVHEHYSKAH
jgi:ketosteroid isomerase-like protein